ncbi:TPA: uracil-DNA glycosylase [Streptococcus suis]
MDWQTLMQDYWQSPEGQLLAKQVDKAYLTQQVYPARDQVFKALELTPFDQVRVVILGQDPYHQPGQAMGLAFSVPNGQKVPPSLRNIYRELSTDLESPMPTRTDLTPWAKQGVLLLNTSLTVMAGQANSHQDLGWSRFTDYLIKALSQRQSPLVFVLWGKPAQAKRTLIDEGVHTVITSVHPSPLSAYRGFFGSKPFTRINDAIFGPPIDWLQDLL